MVVTLPVLPRATQHASRWRELTAGITTARQDRVVGRCLVTVFVFSLLALAFIGQMPVVAAHNLGIDPKSAELRAALRLLRHRRAARRHLDRHRVRPAAPSR